MKADTIAAIIIIAALIWATWYVVAKASEPRIESQPPCHNEWGHPREQEWCDRRE